MVSQIHLLSLPVCVAVSIKILHSAATQPDALLSLPVIVTVSTKLWSRRSDPAAGQAYWDFALRRLVDMFLGAFREKETDGEQDAEALELFKKDSTTLQHYVLHIFRRILTVTPSTLDVFRCDSAPSGELPSLCYASLLALCCAGACQHGLGALVEVREH